HYALFAHQMDGNPAGRGNMPGMDFVVSLGQVDSAPDPKSQHPVGTRSMQASTFMHELGHNLNLNHGGNEETNCKTNYISVMNDMTVEWTYVNDAPLDFSRETLPSLNKGALNEPNGIGTSTSLVLKTIYNGPGTGQPPLFSGPLLTDTGRAVDFNYNGVSTDLNAISDINGGLICGTPGPASVPGPGNNNRIGTINGFSDWASNLQYISPPPAPQEGIAVQQAEVSLVSDRPQDITYQQIKEARLHLLTGIDNSILRLENESETELAAVAEFNTTGIAEDLQSDQLDAAIAQLLVLKSQVIEAFGEEAANREVVPMIDNLVGVLENQKYPTPPPASDCTGTGSGNTRITGTPDPDTLIGTSGLNTINGLAGDDRINGCAGGDRIDGNADDDGIAGGPQNDILNGNEGDDVMQGDEGNDQLSGGAGINTLTGGPGRDSFICSPNSETTITDFEPGIDRIIGPCVSMTEATTATTTLSSTETALPVTEQEQEEERGAVETEIQAREEIRKEARNAAVDRYISSSAAAAGQSESSLLPPPN
ncbi:MAG: calcium-binding protein, partial [Nitrososphaeraceae archaeon]